MSSKGYNCEDNYDDNNTDGYDNDNDDDIGNFDDDSHINDEDEDEHWCWLCLEISQVVQNKAKQIKSKAKQGKAGQFHPSSF
jgi:hypothetical protein